MNATGGLIIAALAVLALFLARLQGKEVGKREGETKGAEIIKDIREEEADEELEEIRSGSITDRIARIKRKYLRNYGG